MLILFYNAHIDLRFRVFFFFFYILSQRYSCDLILTVAFQGL